MAVELQAKKGSDKKKIKLMPSGIVKAPQAGVRSGAARGGDRSVRRSSTLATQPTQGSPGSARRQRVASPARQPHRSMSPPTSAKREKGANYFSTSPPRSPGWSTARYTGKYGQSSKKQMKTKGKTSPVSRPQLRREEEIGHAEHKRRASDYIRPVAFELRDPKDKEHLRALGAGVDGRVHRHLAVLASMVPLIKPPGVTPTASAAVNESSSPPRMRHVHAALDLLRQTAPKNLPFLHALHSCSS